MDERVINDVWNEWDPLEVSNTSDVGLIVNLKTGALRTIPANPEPRYEIRHRLSFTRDAE